jgi:hypothetical protein
VARKQGHLESKLSPAAVSLQIHHSTQFASIQWALGRINNQQFEARALYGLNLAFLGTVTNDRRSEVESVPKRLEPKLGPKPT